MSTRPYFQVVTNATVFANKFNAEQQKQFSEFADKLPAANNWGRSHLFACRVLRSASQPNLLPVLREYKVTPTNGVWPTEIQQFLQGPLAKDLGQSEHELVRTYGSSLGQIWAALALFNGPRADQNRTEVSVSDSAASPSTAIGGYDLRSTRARATTVRPGFVSSLDIAAGSSESSATEPSRRSSKVGYVDTESQHPSSLPEDETVRLVSVVLRHILHYSPPQDRDDLDVVVEFRDAKLRHVGQTKSSDKKVVAIDDGGLCKREIDKAGVFKTLTDCVALLEAKKRFQKLHDGRPIITDECFAQMTGEALAVIANAENNAEKSVIVIHATKQYLCFLHFDFSGKYLDDFDSTSPTSFLHVTSTPWFNLASSTGREHVLNNLCAIMQRATD